MCIGNLRSGTDALSVFVRTGNKTSLKKAGYYFGIILFFAIGAGDRWKPFNAVRNPHNMDFKCTAFNQRTSYVCGEIKNIM